MYYADDIVGVNRILDIQRINYIVHVMDAPDTPRIITPIPRPLLRAIDDYRFSQRLPSRAEAIRQLIELGLHTTLGDDSADAPYDPSPAQKETAK